MVEDVETPKVVVEVLTVTECLLFRERTFFAFQREAYDFVSFIKELFKPGIVLTSGVEYHHRLNYVKITREHHLSLMLSILKEFLSCSFYLILSTTICAISTNSSKQSFTY